MRESPNYSTDRSKASFEVLAYFLHEAVLYTLSLLYFRLGGRESTLEQNSILWAPSTLEATRYPTQNNEARCHLYA